MNLEKKWRWNMTKNKNSHPEGFICESFVYLQYLEVYLNSSDMNESCEIAFKDGEIK